MDLELLHLLNLRLASPAWDAAMIGASTVGLALFPLVALLLWRGQRRLSMSLVGGMALGLSLALALQQGVARPRPPGVRELLGQPDCYSFPSGHAVLVFVCAGVLLRSTLPAALRWGALLLAGLVSLSRVALGHHWPSDVLAGALLGLGVGLGAWGLWGSGDQGARRWRWLLWPHLGLAALVSLAAWLHLLPAIPPPLNDKVLHFLLLGCVSFWLSLSWEDPARPGGPLRLAGMWPWAVLLPFGLACLEELAQAWSPVRSADPLDLACDLGGMLCAWALARRVLRWFGSGPGRSLSWSETMTLGSAMAEPSGNSDSAGHILADRDLARYLSSGSSRRDP